MTIKYIPFTILISLISCQTTKKDPIIHSVPDRYIAYIETPSDRSIYSPNNFIVLIDWETKEKRYLLKDDFENDELCVSPDGKTLGFISSRSGNKQEFEILGRNSPSQLYKYDLASGRMSLLVNNPKFNNLGKINCFKWYNNDSILCITKTNELYMVSLESDFIQMIIAVQGLGNIYDIHVSPDKKYIAFSYLMVEPKLNGGVGIINLINHNLEFKIDSISMHGGWFDSNNIIVSRDNDLELYNVIKKEYSALAIPDSIQRYNISDLFLWNTDSIICLASNQQEDIHYGKNEIYSFKLTGNQIFKNSSDYLQKEDLIFYNKSKIAP